MGALSKLTGTLNFGEQSPEQIINSVVSSIKGDGLKGYSAGSATGKSELNQSNNEELGKEEV